MPTINLDLDRETFRILTALAVGERRPIPWQAEIILRRALGTFPPLAAAIPEPTNAPEEPALVPCATE